MTPSPFIWYELMTTDDQAAAAFYSDVVGWKPADAGMPGMRYTLMQVGEQPMAGVMKLLEEASDAGAMPAWAGYVAVADVDAMAVKLTAAGGTINHSARDIPGVGRFATVADPHGAVFCLFRGNDEQPPQPEADTPGTIGWHELSAGDRDSAWDFYSGLFGWTKDQAMDMGPGGVYQLFATGGEAIGGMMTKPAQMPRSAWLYYFRVDALDAAVDRVKAGGGQLLNGPMAVPGDEWVAQCSDPQGAMFALLAPTR